jgi:hypothetical protein
MTILYLIVSLVVLVAISLVAYFVRGPKFALGVSLVTSITLLVFYLALVMLVTSRM